MDNNNNIETCDGRRSRKGVEGHFSGESSWQVACAGTINPMVLLSHHTRRDNFNAHLRLAVITFLHCPSNSVLLCCTFLQLGRIWLPAIKTTSGTGSNIFHKHHQRFLQLKYAEGKVANNFHYWFTRQRKICFPFLSLKKNNFIVWSWLMEVVRQDSNLLY